MRLAIRNTSTFRQKQLGCVLFPVFGGMVAEGLDRLDFEWLQVNEEDTPTIAAGVAAAARGRIIKLGYA